MTLSLAPVQCSVQISRDELFQVGFDLQPWIRLHLIENSLFEMQVGAAGAEDDVRTDGQAIQNVTNRPILRVGLGGQDVHDPKTHNQYAADPAKASPKRGGEVCGRKRLIVPNHEQRCFGMDLVKLGVLRQILEQFF